MEQAENIIITTFYYIVQVIYTIYRNKLYTYGHVCSYHYREGGGTDNRELVSMEVYVYCYLSTYSSH